MNCVYVVDYVTKIMKEMKIKKDIQKTLPTFTSGQSRINTTKRDNLCRYKTKVFIQFLVPSLHELLS